MQEPLPEPLKEIDSELARARSCSAGELERLLASTSERTIAALLENPALNENHVRVLLERRELSTSLIEQIAGNKRLLASRRVRIGLVAHPHTPPRVALRLAREMYLMDLVGISLRPSAHPEVRRFADELLLRRIPELPLGQKMALARQASGRVAAALLAEGHARVVERALENARLTEAQVLRVLASAELPVAAITAIGRHEKWSRLGTVQAALLRHPRAPLNLVLSVIPDLSPQDLERIGRIRALRAEVHAAIRRELASRSDQENTDKRTI